MVKHKLSLLQQFPIPNESEISDHVFKKTFEHSLQSKPHNRIKKPSSQTTQKFGNSSEKQIFQTTTQVDIPQQNSYKLTYNKPTTPLPF